MSELYIQKRLPVSKQEQTDLRRFHELEQERTRLGRIKPSHVKFYARIKTRLIASGVIAPGSRDNVRAVARQAYKAMPWYKKLRLIVKYYTLRVRDWFKSSFVETKN